MSCFHGLLIEKKLNVKKCCVRLPTDSTLTLDDDDPYFFRAKAVHVVVLGLASRFRCDSNANKRKKMGTKRNEGEMCRRLIIECSEVYW